MCANCVLIRRVEGTLNHEDPRNAYGEHTPFWTVNREYKRGKSTWYVSGGGRPYEFGTTPEDGSILSIGQAHREADRIIAWMRAHVFRAIRSGLPFPRDNKVGGGPQ